MSISSSLLKKIKGKSEIRLASEGISMIPFLQPGDVLYFKKTPFGKISVNDFIGVIKSGKIFTHRVMYKRDNFVISKGDNNQFSDGKISPRQIFGKVYKIHRNKRKITPDDIYFLQSTLYFQEIIALKKIFETEEVNYVFLKGLPIHLYYEKYFPRRRYADCDVLVGQDDAEKVEKILEQRGYKKADTSYSKIHTFLKDKKTESTYSKIIHSMPVVFDIHYEIVFLLNQVGRLDALYPQSCVTEMTNRFLHEKRWVKIQGSYFPILSPSNLIIYLSLHFFHHNYRGIYMLYMLHNIAKKTFCKKGKKLENEVIEKIKKYKVQNFIYCSFIFLNRYYTHSIPLRVIESTKPVDIIRRYVNNNFIKLDVFDDESRVKAGINRFKNIFYLSPYPNYRKFFIIFNLGVIYSFLWVVIRLVNKSFRHSLTSFSAR